MRFRNLKKNTKVKKEKKSGPSYASITNRIKAFITDMFMIYIPILYFITYVVLSGKEEFQTSTIAPFIGVALYGFIYAILLAKLGQTPGKKAYTIKVVHAQTYENLTFFQALWRFMSFLLSATLLLGLFLSFYREDKCSLHDLLANSIVIDLEEV